MSVEVLDQATPNQELATNMGVVETAEPSQEAIDTEFAAMVDAIGAIPPETKETIAQQMTVKVQQSGDWTGFKST